jgi:hypothetical protein
LSCPAAIAGDAIAFLPLSVWTFDPVDSGARRNGLSEADPHVPAKLAEQRLHWGEEAEALPRRQVVGDTAEFMN